MPERIRVEAEAPVVEGAPSIEALAKQIARRRLSKAAATMGAAGRGEAKRRGDSEHYRALVAQRKDRVKTYEATLTTVDGVTKRVRVTIPED